MNYYTACFWLGCAFVNYTIGEWKLGVVWTVAALAAVTWSLGFRVRRA